MAFFNDLTKWNLTDHFLDVAKKCNGNTVFLKLYHKVPFLVPNIFNWYDGPLSPYFTEGFTLLCYPIATGIINLRARRVATRTGALPDNHSFTASQKLPLAAKW